MKICIDAGHCTTGGDVGAQGNGLQEERITFLIADKLKDLLESVNQEVVMTRSFLEQCLGETEAQSLNQRVRICNANNCDIFVSIHCNAHDKKQSNGTEVLILQKGGQAEELAQSIQNQIIGKLSTTDRGVKEQNCCVLRDTACPAVLVECAFITNEADSLLLRYRHDDFAEGIFDGICATLGVLKPVRYSYDDTVNQMIFDGVTTASSMAYWEQTLAQNPYTRTIIERYQNLLKSF